MKSRSTQQVSLKQRYLFLKHFKSAFFPFNVSAYAAPATYGYAAVTYPSVVYQEETYGTDSAPGYYLSEDEYYQTTTEAPYYAPPGDKLNWEKKFDAFLIDQFPRFSLYNTG